MLNEFLFCLIMINFISGFYCHYLYQFGLIVIVILFGFNGNFMHCDFEHVIILYFYLNISFMFVIFIVKIRVMYFLRLGYLCMVIIFNIFIVLLVILDYHHKVNDFSLLSRCNEGLIYLMLVTIDLLNVNVSTLLVEVKVAELVAMDIDIYMMLLLR